MNRRRVAITGTGSLASSLVHAIVQHSDWPLDVVLISRDAKRLRWLVASTRANIALVRGRIRVSSRPIVWEDSSSLSTVFGSLDADVVIHTASMQSAWSLCGSDRWSRLVRELGYGFTLPLQLLLTSRLGRVLAQEAPTTALFNACYPDAANAVIRPHVPNLVCGIGNVATLTALMAVDLCKKNEVLRMVAHHSDFAKIIAHRDVGMTPLVWRDEVPISDEAMQWFEQASIPADDSLNVVTAAAVLPVLGAWLGLTASVRANLPGVFGLLGGYPTKVANATMELDLPAIADLSEAIERNVRASIDDGISVSAEGVAHFAPEVRERVAASSGIASRLTEPFDFSAVEGLASDFLELRELLQADRSS